MKPKSAQTWTSWIPVAVAGMGVLIAAFLVLRPNTSPGLVGHQAPNFTLRNVTGQLVSLNAYRGHPVVLNFWGVSCIYCRTEMPILEQSYLRHAPDGLVILGIDDENDDAASIRDFTSERGVKYTMLLDPNAQVGTAYGVKPLPESFFIDRNGILRAAEPTPFLDQGWLEQALTQIL